MRQSTMTVAGIDTGKAFLDLAVIPGGAVFRVGNDPQGWCDLIDLLNVLGRLVALEPRQAELLERILASEMIDAADPAEPATA